MATDEARRARRLGEMVGNDRVRQRIGRLLAAGGPRRLLLHGPYGSGKTTLARIVVRRRRCRGAGPGDVEPCLECEACRRGFGPDWEIGGGAWFDRDLGAHFDDRAYSDASTHFGRPEFTWHLEEAGDVDKGLQRTLADALEAASCSVIVTTTHLASLEPRLIERFGTSVLELAHPAAEECAGWLERTLAARGVNWDERSLLLRAARSVGCNMRKVVDFADEQAAAAPGRRLTADLLDLLFDPEDGPEAPLGGPTPGMPLI